MAKASWVQQPITSLTYPEPLLLRPARQVDKQALDTYTLPTSLTDAWFNQDMPVTSANQVGLDEAVIAFNFNQTTGLQSSSASLLSTSLQGYTLMFNPVLVEHSIEQFTHFETCRNLPGVALYVQRYNNIKIEAYCMASNGFDSTPSKRTLVFTGQQAGMIQHHLDHLQGKTLLDKIDEQEKPRYLGYIDNAKALLKRLAVNYKAPDNSIVYHVNENLILRTGDNLSLYFAEAGEGENEFTFSGVMSTINLSQPFIMSSIYSQALMLVLAFQPKPQQLYMLGFGGGIVPICLHHYIPNIVINGSEIDADVAAIAQSHFGVQLDDRMQMSVADGLVHIEQQPEKQFDIILLDTFTGTGDHPDILATPEFYALCLSRLKDEGIIATNLVTQDPKFDEKVANFTQAFKHAYMFHHEQGNVICFGSEQIKLDTQTLAQRGQYLQQYYGFLFPFALHAKQIRVLN